MKIMLFNIYLINREGKITPLNALRTNEGVVLTLNPDRPTSFTINNHPDFLQKNNAFYLGKEYSPQVFFDNQQHYLSSSGYNVYTLSSTPAQSDFSFILTNPNTLWGTPDDISNIKFQNFNVPSDITGYYFYNRCINGNLPLTISPTMSPDSGVEAEGFSNPNGTAFVIRTNRGIFTYKINGNKLIAAVVHPSIITSNHETDNTVRERAFQIDSRNIISANQYPIYVMSNNQKRYLSNPQTSGDTVTYDLVNMSNSSTAAFTPNRPIMSGSTINQEQFKNFVVPRETAFTIRFNTQSNTPPPVAAPPVASTLQTPSPTIQVAVPPRLSPLASSQPAVLSTVQQTFWQRWWMIIAIIGFLLLLIIIGFVVYMLGRSRRTHVTSNVVTPAVAAYATT